jgi:hypothetical protein
MLNVISKGTDIFFISIFLCVFLCGHVCVIHTEVNLEIYPPAYNSRSIPIDITDKRSGPFLKIHAAKFLFNKLLHKNVQL